MTHRAAQPARRLLRNMRRAREVRERVEENVERVEWTMKDEAWKPSREYLAKLLSAYKADTAMLLAIVGVGEALRKDEP